MGQQEDEAVRGRWRSVQFFLQPCVAHSRHGTGAANDPRALRPRDHPPLAWRTPRAFVGAALLRVPCPCALRLHAHHAQQRSPTNRHDDGLESMVPLADGGPAPLPTETQKAFPVSPEGWPAPSSAGRTPTRWGGGSGVRNLESGSNP